jgi:hypothetical protein
MTFSSYSAPVSSCIAKCGPPSSHLDFGKETRYLWVMYPVSSNGLSTLFILHRSRANCSKCGLPERSFKLSDRFERSANSFFTQFARRSTLYSFRSENRGSLIAFERSLNLKEQCAQLCINVRGCVSLKKYKSQGKAVEVTVNNNFCLDFVQEFSLWRRGPCPSRAWGTSPAPSSPLKS